MSLMPGQVLQGRYTIQVLLGQGGFGAVYQAHDGRLNQTVALKENLGGDARQFQQEAVLLANLRHPNLPRVSDHFVEPNGAQYLVMDFIAGEDLEARVQQHGALSEADAIRWMTQILDAVAYLHSMGVIHRDIKPANIKIMPSGQAVLVDFGIAKVVQPGMRTMTGAKAVSPGYAAPEQYHGGTDQRSDVYSLGATLYAILVGGDPPDAPARERGIATLTPPRVLNASISVQTDQVIMRAMAVQPQRRFQSAMEMRFALSPVHQAVATVPAGVTQSAATIYAPPIQVAPPAQLKIPSPATPANSHAARSWVSAPSPIVQPILVGSVVGGLLEILSWIPTIGACLAISNLGVPLAVGIWAARRRREWNAGRLTFSTAFWDGVRSGAASSIVPALMTVVIDILSSLFYLPAVAGSDTATSVVAVVVGNLIVFVLRLPVGGILGASGAGVYRAITGD